MEHFRTPATVSARTRAQERSADARCSGRTLSRNGPRPRSRYARGAHSIRRIDMSIVTVMVRGRATARRAAGDSTT